MVPRSGQKLRRGCRYDLLSRKLVRRNAQFFCRPLTEGPVFFVSLFYRHAVPAAPRVSPCATDIPSLRDWGNKKPPTCGGHTPILPTCRPYGAGETGMPSSLLTPEGCHIGNDGCQPGGTRAKPIFRMMPISTDMPSLRLPGFHPALPIYRPYGTGETGMPSSLQTPQGYHIGRHNPPSPPSSSSGGATYR